jgi:hypothetical protein
MPNLPNPAHHNFRVHDHIYVRGGTHRGCCGTVVKVHGVMVSVRIHNPIPYVVRIKPKSCTRASPFITPREAMYDWMLPGQNEIGGIYFLTADMSDKIDALLVQMHTDGVQDKIDAVLRHIQGRMDVE